MMPTNVRREILGTSKLTYKYQLTVPKKVREKFQLKEGETLVFIDQGGRPFLVKSTEL